MVMVATADTQAANIRREAILRYVDEFARAWSAWVDNTQSAAIEPESAMADALEQMCVVCHYGDIPQDCRELVTAVNVLRLEYEQYQEGQFVPRTLEPLPALFRAAARVLECRHGVAAPRALLVESVRSLRAQKVNDLQIAKAYGVRHPDTGLWSGPFHGPNGQVLSLLIDQEHDQPGSVIHKGWTHPADQIARRRAEEQFQGCLRRSEQRAVAAAQKGERAVRRPTDAEVAEYLREGAFQHQVLKVWPMLTADDVLAIARANDIRVTVRPAVEPPAAVEAIAEVTDAPVRDMGTPGAATTESVATEAAVRATIERLISEGRPNQDIRREVINRLGVTVTTQKIVALRTQLAPAADTPDDDDQTER